MNTAPHIGLSGLGNGCLFKGIVHWKIKMYNLSSCRPRSHLDYFVDGWMCFLESKCTMLGLVRTFFNYNIIYNCVQLKIPKGGMKWRKLCVNVNFSFKKNNCKYTATTGLGSAPTKTLHNIY